MALSCPIDLDVAKLREEISRIYSAVATDAEADFHFHRGPNYAADCLGYDAEELAQLPEEATAAFAGVGNPISLGEIRAGSTVVDVGCGSGMDLLLAARRAGESGRAIGIDMTEAMRDRASTAAQQAGLTQVEVRAGDALELPIGDAEADVVISNGVVNLTIDKYTAFAEIFRVLKPGGRLQLSDISVTVEMSEDGRNDIDLWTS